MDHYEKEYPKNEENIKEMFYNPLHCWIEIDGLIVDLTASQFNKEIDEPVKPTEIDTYKDIWKWTPLGKE